MCEPCMHCARNYRPSTLLEGAVESLSHRECRWVVWNDRYAKRLVMGQGRSGSERRVKPQRHVVNQLAYYLSPLLFSTISLIEAKDNRPARKG
jgi:hypothetical protein